MPLCCSSALHRGRTAPPAGRCRHRTRAAAGERARPRPLACPSPLPVVTRPRSVALRSERFRGGRGAMVRAAPTPPARDGTERGLGGPRARLCLRRRAGAPRPFGLRRQRPAFCGVTAGASRPRPGGERGRWDRAGRDTCFCFWTITWNVLVLCLEGEI